MNSLDKFALSGFISSFGIYYYNKSTHIISNLNLPNDIYNLTIGGMPEYFTGLLGVRIANYSGKLFENIVNNKKIKKIRNKIPKKLDNIIENISENSQKYSTLASSSLILGLGTIDETIYNISGGTQDLNDILMYGLGIGTAIYFGNKNK